MRLLVIADDFTGALDTGVQFKAKGTLIRVGSSVEELFQELNSEVQVLIVDAETRHMTAQEAYQTVYRIVARAMELGVACVYKKTDSGLRGNIGSELTAMLEASGRARMHFIPAFPLLNRITAGGIHYIDGCPAADSVFGKDPFEPVLHSDVRGIIAEQSEVRTTVMEHGVTPQLPDGILVYDASTDEDLGKIARALRDSGELGLVAGCAGFASVLPDVLELVPGDSQMPLLHQRLLTICGSINPITLSQLDEAQRHGALRIQLTPEQKLDPEWLDSEEGCGTVQAWFHQIQRASNAIVEGNRTGDGEATRHLAQQRGMSLEAVRRQIARTMGGVLERLLALGLDATVLVTGGDTLLAFMRRIGQNALMPIGELAPGVVLSQIEHRGKRYNIVSKSGGFGSASLLLDLEETINSGKSKEELIC